MDVTVVVATFGDQEWVELAHDRAIPSAQDQAPIIHQHGDTLAEARNTALGLVATEWVIHLDADDELGPGYVEAMARAAADVRAPLVCYVERGRERRWRPAVFGHHHDCEADCLRDGNWIVIGAAVRTALVRSVGGWREFDWSEDWDLWLRCYLAGASFEFLPDALYRAHVRHDSRNRGATQAAKDAAHRAIYEANLA